MENLRVIMFIILKVPDPYFHSRQIEWFASDIPRSNFDQDLLYSFGAFMTICRISRNNAEQRIYDMEKKRLEVTSLLNHSHAN